MKIIINLLCSTTSQIPEFRTKTFVEINDNTKTGGFEVTDQIKFKTAILKLRLCGYSDAYVFCKRCITITGAGKGVAGRQADEGSNA